MPHGAPWPGSMRRKTRRRSSRPLGSLPARYRVRGAACTPPYGADRPGRTTRTGLRSTPHETPGRPRSRKRLRSLRRPRPPCRAACEAACTPPYGTEPPRPHHRARPGPRTAPYETPGRPRSRKTASGPATSPGREREGRDGNAAVAPGARHGTGMPEATPPGFAFAHRHRLNKYPRDQARRPRHRPAPRPATRPRSDFRPGKSLRLARAVARAGTPPRSDFRPPAS